MPRNEILNAPRAVAFVVVVGVLRIGGVVEPSHTLQPK